MFSKYARIFPALGVGVLCFLIASPVMAHPGSLWGIDLSSVVTLRDQARVLAHSYDTEDDESDPVDGLDRIRTVVIDPGHGGDNSGATGVAGIQEKYLTLELAYLLRERLQEKYPDLRVILTRYWDTSLDLPDRVHLANMANADLLISLHYNAAPHDRAIGFETYFSRSEDVTPGQQAPQGLPIASADSSVTGMQAPIEGVTPFGQSGDTLTLIKQDLLRAHQHDLSGSLAETVQARFKENLESIDRGVKQANFAVLQGAHMPAIVVEAGFLTHPEEGIEVTTPEHRTVVANALIGAIEDFDGTMAERLADEESQRNAQPTEEPSDQHHVDDSIADFRH